MEHLKVVMRILIALATPAARIYRELALNKCQSTITLFMHMVSSY